MLGGDITKYMKFFESGTGDYDNIELVHVTSGDRMISEHLGTSRGYQVKWYDGQHYIKQDLLGYEGVAEWMVSKLLLFSDLAPDEYVMYQRCRIYEDGRFSGNGCFSRDFTDEAEIITVADILDKTIMSYNVGYDELRELLYDIVGFDVKPYIDKILCLDAITRNEDRHFNNVAFLYKDGIYKPAPIFDNGAACMSDIFTYPLDTEFITNISRIMAKPFSTKFENQIQHAKPLVIDRDGFLSALKDIDDFMDRALRTIQYGLQETEGIAWIKR